MLEFFVVMFVFAVMFVHMEHNAQKKRAKAEFNYVPEPFLGSAGYATDKDCKRAGLFARTGIPCGYSPESGRPLKYAGDAMAITIAPTGSGKGTCQELPALMSLDDRSIIALCSKGEAPAITAAYRAKLGPCNTVAPYGGVPPNCGGIVGAKLNPMDPLSDRLLSEANFNAESRALAEPLIFRETQNAESEFFNSTSVNAVHAVIMGVARHEPREKRTLNRVAEICATDEIFEWSRKISDITDVPFLKQKLGLFATAKGDDRTLMGILQTVRSNLDFLNDPGVADSVSRSDFDYGTDRDEIATQFITVPPNRIDVGGRFLALHLNTALNRLLRPGRGERRVTIICDEFFSYGALPAVEKAIGISRAFGVQIWPILQDLSQLEARYPKTYQTFLANAGLRVFMTPQDQKTASYVSEQIGITTVSQWQKSVNFDQQNGVKPGWTRPPSARPLEHPHEVRACSEDRMYVFVRGLANVIKARRIPYFQRAEFRGKYRDNPYYKRASGVFSRIFG
ncbi:MAG: type IV secretory system conjugative DNA transfer family protein [Acidobacteriaceae bacterium]|jgi:type IV secretion system protein VirD4